MIVITDSPTFLLEKCAKESNFLVTSILYFPHECELDFSKSTDFALILITESFYNYFKERESSLSNSQSQYDNVFILLDRVINKLNTLGIHIYIPFVPKHFLYNDRFREYYYDKKSQNLYIENINHKLYSSYSDSPNITFLKGIGELNETISKNYFRFGTIYDKVNSDLIIEQICFHKAQVSKKIKKLIILDLDNTLWKGTLGDDYLEGIRMDESDPIGSIFRSVQRIILKLKDQGFLIAICSKNEQDIALKALFNNSSSLFNKNDIISYRINWESKSKNILEICNELNISPQDTIFIDDSDYECDEVKRNCKGISVIKVPKNIYDYPLLLATHKLFDLGLSSEEDKLRTDFYKARIKRNSLYSKAIKNDLSKKDWIKSLNQSLEINKVNLMAKNMDRIIQLFNRTNQFNLSGSKYNIHIFNEILKINKNRYYYAIASDRIGSEGLISVLGYCTEGNKITVLDYILSCRVFGRFIEESMLIPLFDIALRAKYDIYFDFKDTGRNKVVNDFIGKITDWKYFLPLDKVKVLNNNYKSLFISLSINQELMELNS